MAVFSNNSDTSGSDTFLAASEQSIIVFRNLQDPCPRIELIDEHFNIIQ